jgi:hypothetical protein
LRPRLDSDLKNWNKRIIAATRLRRNLYRRAAASSNRIQHARGLKQVLWWPRFLLDKARCQSFTFFYSNGK